ncbi:MAG: RsmD family RNA methyltransferase [Deltaproteobacteria bacterium]|nr:RsmD family RNA methyltransferase [Deltaproteobacteria bacterium]
MPQPDCPHAARCGGCPSPPCEYPAELARKEALVRRALARHAILAGTPVLPVVPAEPSSGYRVRAKLVAAPGARLGLFARGGSHEVVDIPGCPLLAPSIASVASALRELLAAAPAAAGPVLRAAGGPRAGALRAVDLREVLGMDGSAAVMAALVLDAARWPSEAQLAAAAAAIVRRAPAVIAVAASRHDGRRPQLLGSPPALVWGASAAPDRVAPTSPVFVHAVPGAFVQAHRAQAARIYELVAHELQEALGSLAGRHAIDAYAGSGAMGFMLALRGATVTLVESFLPAAIEAGRAAAAQGLDVRVAAGDAARVLSRLRTGGEAVDALVLDPPRAGLAPAARAACAALRPLVAAYVSCDPDTLGRDLADLARLGLRPERVVPFDMMPRSAEIETVTLLRPAVPAPPAVLHEEPDLLVVDKPAHEPTTPQAEGQLSLLARVRALPGLSCAVAVHRLDAGTSGLCLIAKAPQAAGRWARALGATTAEKEYLALCRGIARGKGTVRRPLRDAGRDRAACTHYRRLAVVAGHSFLRLRLEHGRTHQIRRHLAAIGHPVLGDGRYGHAPSNRHFAEKHGLDRPFLHCARLSIPHPDGGRTLEVASPLPGDLRLVLERLEMAEAGAASRSASQFSESGNRGPDREVIGQSIPAFRE